MNNFIKFEDLNFKINPPTFNEFLKTEVKCKPIDIEKITKTINSKKLEFTIKESTDKVIYENFIRWKNIINKQNNGYCDSVIIRKLTKPYPYKSKRKRLVKKWWDYHSKLVTLNNVMITESIKK